MKKILGLNVASKLFISFLVALAIPTIISLIIINSYTNDIKTFIDDAHHSSFATFTNSIEDGLYDIFSLSYKLSTNQTIKDYDYSPVDVLTQFDLAFILSRESVTSGIYDRYYLYYPNKNQIITTSYTSSAEDFFSTTAYSNIDVSSITDDIDVATDFYLTTLKNTQTEKIEAYCFIRNIEGTTAKIIFEIRSETLQRLLGDSLWTDNSMLYVIDDDINYIVSDSSQEAMTIGELLLSDTTHDDTISSNGKTYTYLEFDSKHSNWRYVYLSEYLLLSDEQSRVLINILLLILLGFLISIAVSLFFIKKNYRPLQSILNHLKIQYNNSENNEYDIILSSIKKIESEHENLTYLIEQHSIQLRDTYFSKLLNGNFSSSSNIKEICSLYDIEYNTGLFVVAVIKIHEDTNLFFSDMETNSEEDEVLIEVIIKNVLSEMLEQYAKSYVLKHNNYFVSIINLNDEHDLNNVKIIFDEFLQILSGRFGIVSEYEITDTYKDYINISKAYKEVENKISNGDNAILSIQLGIQRQISIIINNIENQKYDEAIALIDDMFSDVATMNSQNTTYYILNIVLEYAKFLYDNEYIQQNSFSVFETTNSIEYLNDIEKLKSQMAQSVDYIKSKNSIKINKKENIVYSAIKIIKDEFSSPDLSLIYIADRLKVNSSYLSRKFNEELGNGLVQYIHMYRINQSKILIDNDNSILIEELAKKVGFISANTFIKVFKKITGVTPGQYKKK